MNEDDRKLQPVSGGSSFFRWPTKTFGPAPGLRELNLICWGLFLGFELIPFFVPVWIHAKTGTAFARLLPIDFTYFFGIGRIVNQFSFARLYDYELQLQVFNDICPLRDTVYGPSPYPPFVALFFTLFARLPFPAAYLLWVAVSLALYLIGIGATIRVTFPGECWKASLIFCFAVAFYPFFICTLKLGQLSTIAVFAVGLALLQEKNARPIASGLALSILAYKPTLLVLIVPMLLLTRRFRAFLGFVIGVAALVLVTTAFAGLSIWTTYAHFLAFFRQTSVVNGQSRLQLWEYVDLTSLSYAIPYGRSSAASIVLIAISVAILSVLAVALWKTRAAYNARNQSLAWAATLTWTLLLNLYVPVWDSILVVIAIILTLAALRDLSWNDAAGWIILLALLIFAVTWNLAARESHHGSQYMTLLLFVLGSAQLVLLFRAVSEKPQLAKSTPVAA